jgi:hypothetical protein
MSDGVEGEAVADEDVAFDVLVRFLEERRD